MTNWHDNILLDPTADSASTCRDRLPPPADLRRGVVALLDIGKMRGDEYIDELERQLGKLGYQTRRYAKPTNVKVAPTDLVQRIVDEADFVIEALADCGSCTSCAIHDVNTLDQLGVPGLLVATTEFLAAAEAQSNALAFKPAIVWVEHPVQNRTTAELHEMARRSMTDVKALMTP